MRTCGECDGRRHVLVAGVWNECECLRRERRVKLWRAARIPVRHDAETWKSFLSRFFVGGPPGFPLLDLKASVEALRRGDSSGTSLALAGDSEGRELAASLLLRTAIEGSLSAELCDLRRLIDFEFGKPAVDAPDGAPRERGLLAVRVGDEPKNPWNKVALERLLIARRDAALGTILVCAAAPTNLGAIYVSDEIAEAIAGRFTVVEVGPRERA